MSKELNNSRSSSTSTSTEATPSSINTPSIDYLHDINDLISHLKMLTNNASNLNSQSSEKQLPGRYYGDIGACITLVREKTFLLETLFSNSQNNNLSINYEIINTNINELQQAF